jgi:hypothetical protein
MSWRLVEKVWDLDLPPIQQHVLLALARHADDDGRRCFPSVATLARETGRSRRTVQQILRELASAGVLAIAHPGGGRGVATEYAIRLGQVAPKPAGAGEGRSAKGARAAPFLDHERAQSQQERAQNQHEKGATPAPHSVKGTGQETVNRGRGARARAKTPTKPGDVDAATWVRVLAFDAELSGLPGYRQSGELLAAIARDYARIDLAAVANEIGCWLPGSDKGRCSRSVILAFLTRRAAIAGRNGAVPSSGGQPRRVRSESYEALKRHSGRSDAKPS